MKAGKRMEAMTRSAWQAGQDGLSYEAWHNDWHDGTDRAVEPDDVEYAVVVDGDGNEVRRFRMVDHEQR